MLLTLFPLSGPLSARERDDAYLTGYAAAVLEQQFHLSGESVQVQDGVVTVPAQALAAVDPAQVTAALAQIRGVTRVKIQATSPPIQAPVTSGPNLAHDPAPLLQRRQATGLEGRAASGFLPSGVLFDPLLADPRWPHFAMTYRYYLHGRQRTHVGTADFGETIALYRTTAPWRGQWEVGLQAAVFSLFALDTQSADLVNADYFVALPLSYRHGDFSALVRMLHQSSHLGDEFLLRTRVQRINLSYQALDLLLSYELFGLLRLYGGGGYLFAREPSGLAPWTTQYGLEVASPWAFAGGTIQPIAAADCHTDEEDEWSTNLSLRAGLEFESWQVRGRKIQLLAEYFTGHSPNGQFFKRQIETIGLGLHLQF